MRVVLFIDLDRRLHIALVAVALRVFRRREPEHLGVGNVPFDGFEQFPVLVVKAAFLERLLDDCGTLLFRINGKVGRKPPSVRKHAQNLDAHGVNGAYPHPRDVRHRTETLPHFVRRFVGERDRENVFGRDPLFRDKMCNAGREYSRLSASRARKHENSALGIEDGRKLFFVELFKLFHTRTLYHTRRQLTSFHPSFPAKINPSLPPPLAPPYSSVRFA